MDTDKHESKQNRIGILILGVLLFVGGAVWIVGIALPLITKLYQDGWPDSLTFAIGAPFYSLMMFLGGLGIYFGWNLIRRPSKHAIKGGVGLIAAMGAIYAASAIEEIFRSSTLSSVAMLLAGLLALPVYVGASKYLIKHAGFEIRPKGEFVGRGIAFIISLLVFAAGNDLVHRIAPAREDRVDAPGDVWFILGFAPLVLAIATYRVWLTVLENRNHE